jgi:hypothetical protein
VARWIQNILLVVACLCVGFTAYTLLWGNNNGGRTDEVRAGIQRVEEYQRNLDARLGRIEVGLNQSIKTAERIAGNVSAVTDAVGAVEARIDNSKTRLESSERRIDEGISILQGIRQKPK